MTTLALAFWVTLSLLFIITGAGTTVFGLIMMAAYVFDLGNPKMGVASRMLLGVPLSFLVTFVGVALILAGWKL